MDMSMRLAGAGTSTRSKGAGTGGGPPAYTAALKFNDARNSQYAFLGWGWL